MYGIQLVTLFHPLLELRPFALSVPNYLRARSLSEAARATITSVGGRVLYPLTTKAKRRA